MKKRILAALLATVLAVVTLIGCQGGIASTGSVKIVIERMENDYAVYEIELDKLENRSEGGISVLEYLKNNTKTRFSYEVDNGMIMAIDLIAPSRSNEYIAIYTNNKKDFATPTAYFPTVPTVEYEGESLTSSGFGISSMHIEDKTVILFRIESF